MFPLRRSYSLWIRVCVLLKKNDFLVFKINQHPTPNTQHPTPNAQHPKMEEGQDFQTLIDEIKALRNEIKALREEMKKETKETKETKLVANYKKCYKCNSDMIPPLTVTKSSFAKYIQCPYCAYENMT